MTEIATWLRGLGLETYARRFIDSGIDLAVLPNLTDEDLKELGVLLGHRRKLRAAIASLPPASHAARPRPASASVGKEAERRQLTVMFCDLVGSTALSTRLDPEDMSRLIQTYQNTCARVIARYEGVIAQFMGDGVLAYFGYPLAHEDDAERAARAGLEITEAVAKLTSTGNERLQARVGIATGVVVVGDPIGGGVSQELPAIGGTPNLASRLQGLAEPGSVVVAKSTRMLLGEAFKLRDLGSHAVKGLAEPIQAWAVEAISAAESRFEAKRAGLTPFVDREAECAIALEQQRRAWRGEGQIVLISGEAGIGKSRFAAWIAEQAAPDSCIKLRYQCSPYHFDSALYPFIDQIERAAHIKSEHDPERMRDRLEALLALATPRVKEIAPLFASLLSIPPGNRYPPLRLGPAQRRRQTIAALLDQLEGLARQKPVLWLFEDAHWADPTSLEVIDLGIERVRNLPVLALITFRPDFEAPWRGLSNVTHLELGGLARGDVETLVGHLTDGRAMPPEVTAQIVAKTDGVPLFVEELTRNVRESGLLIEHDGHYRLRGPLPPRAIPSTIQDSLMARLDRLEAAKEVAQVGAVIGREFSYTLLNAVIGWPENALRDALAQLAGADLLLSSGSAADARYAFKHALVQDTAYESLLRSRRRALHRRMAETLRDKFPSSAAAEPEVIAHHFTEAGLIEPAIEWWGKAGDLALHRSAFKEATAHLGKAIEMSETVVASSSTASQRELVKLHVAYGNALISLRGHSAPETTRAFLRARELIAEIEDAAERFSIYYGLWTASYQRAELPLMRDLADAFLRDVGARPNSPESGAAHRIAGTTCWVQGHYVSALSHYKEALALLDCERDRDLAFRFGQHPFVSAESFLALSLWPLGDVEESAQMTRAAIEHATEVGQIATLANAHFIAGILGTVRRDPRRVAQHAGHVLALSRAHDLALWAVAGMFQHGWAEGYAGNRQAGIAEMRQGLAIIGEQQIRIWVPFIMTVLAELEAEAGEIDLALATLDRAIAETEETGQRWYEAETYRLRGALLMKRDVADFAAAESAFGRAIAIAQAQKTRSFELRAALDLATLYRAADRGGDAHAVLAPALRGFSPTPEFPEIEEAQTLLAALGSRQ